MTIKQFKTESKRLLDLMANSIYTNKVIFLREVYEETGLRLLNVKDVGYIEWLIDGDRHLCILFESESYEGELKSNDEGENLFIDIKDLCQYQFSTDFDKILDIYGIIY